MRDFRASLLIGVLVFATILCQVGLAASADANAPAKKAPAFTVQVTGTGKPMILIPGLGCGGNVWDGTVEHFKDRYQCHVVTLAGFAGQPAIDAPMLPQVRDGLIQYIADKKLEKPVIVGHSLGGFMAFWVAETAPDKVGPIVAVDGVPFFPALRDPKATVESIKPFAEGMRGMYDSQTPEQFAGGFRMFLGTMITEPKNIDMVCRESDKSAPKAVGQAASELMTTDLRGGVKAIKTPVLLIGSTASITDPNQIKAARENYRLQVEAIPTHKLVFAPKELHFIQLDGPEFFYNEVEVFLKDADKPKDK